MLITFESHPEQKTIVLRTLGRSKGGRRFDYAATMKPETSFGGVTYKALAQLKHGSLLLDEATGLATIATSDKMLVASTSREDVR